MNFLHLKYFLLVAEELNITRAAERLYISQQSLSNHISNMERELNVKLFTRSPKLSLTYAGDLLVETATQILDLHSQYLAKVGDINRHYMGVLRLGISHTCGLALLPEILPRFQAEFPMVEFSLFEGNSNQLEDELSHGRVDLIICFQPIIMEGVEAVSLTEQRLVMVVPKVFTDQLFGEQAEEIREKSVEEIDALVNEQFAFDAFQWQYENKIEITEDFRADGLNRILYKCPVCGAEGENEGKGVTLTCKKCGAVHELTVLGRMKAGNGETKFEHIPDWYDWQRAEVRKEIEAGKYLLDTDVSVAILKDHKALYHVGSGRLIHNENGFSLTGCDGKLSYSQPPQSSYTLNSDYFWYEIGDIIAIGNSEQLYYCFPKQRDVVTKARLAAEEMYTICREKKLAARAERRANRSAKAAE